MFGILTHDLRAACLTHKFTDDATLTEVINRNHVIQLFVDELVQQATQSSMNINSKKTKEMLIGSMARNLHQQLTLGGATVDRVATSSRHSIIRIRIRIHPSIHRFISDIIMSIEKHTNTHKNTQTY